MLNIYQEFVRNHQYSLQILAHCKQNRDFDKLLKHYEAKPDCEERTLETFLTYPMFQVGGGRGSRSGEGRCPARRGAPGPEPPTRPAPAAPSLPLLRARVPDGPPPGSEGGPFPSGAQLLRSSQLTVVLGLLLCLPVRLFLPAPPSRPPVSTPASVPLQPCLCPSVRLYPCLCPSPCPTPLSVPIPVPCPPALPQIPRYILTLHELLAHTPHEHVERNSLDYAKSKLEELSR